jgi:NADPH2:quinone reductase
MKGAIIRAAGGPEAIDVEDLEPPEPAADQVRIRVAYAALNPLDTHARANRIPWMHPGFPFTPGFEYAGLVDAVGPGVDSKLIGQRVASNGHWGGNAEFAVAPAATLNPVPQGFDWHTAAAFSTCAYTAWLLVHQAARLREGQSLVVHSAAGAVGSLTAQIARSVGATVIGLAGGESKLEYVRSFGVDHAIDYTTEGWSDSVKELTGGRGADVIVDGNAGPNAARNLDAIAPLGNIIYIGAMAGQAPSLNISALIGKSCSVTGFVQYLHQAVSGGAEKRETHEKLASGEWRIAIGRVYPLDELAEAHRAFEARELVGRTLIEVGGEL